MVEVAKISVSIRYENTEHGEYITGSINGVDVLLLNRHSISGTWIVEEFPKVRVGVLDNTRELKVVNILVSSALQLIELVA